MAPAEIKCNSVDTVAVDDNKVIVDGRSRLRTRIPVFMA
jgi:hypothetical protein